MKEQVQKVIDGLMEQRLELLKYLANETINHFNHQQNNSFSLSEQVKAIDERIDKLLIKLK